MKLVFVLGLLIALELGLSIPRKNRCIVFHIAYQLLGLVVSKLFIFQMVLIAFLLIGFAQNQRGNSNHKTINIWSILIFVILIRHNSLQIVIVKT